MNSKTLPGSSTLLASEAVWTGSPVSTLALATVAAFLFIYGQYGAPLLAALLVLLIALQSLKTPWLAMLALFPLSLSVAAASVSIGIKELAFAGLCGVFWLNVTGQEIARHGWRDLRRQFGLPVALALILLLVNLGAALSHHGLLADWLRGLVPYVFLSMVIPLTLALRGSRERIRWLGISIGLASLLLSAWVVTYFFSHEMWKLYWLFADGTRVFADVAAQNPGRVSGPFIDRITMFIPPSTDVLVPLGMSFGFVLAVLASRPTQRYAALALSALSVACILITYTRSMLLSPVIVILAFMVYLALCQRQRLRFAVLWLFALGLFALAVIYALGLEQVWVARLDLLLRALGAQLAALWSHLMSLLQAHHAGSGHAAGAAATPPLSETLSAAASASKDDNVTSRVEEYRIAWQMFLAHPLLGNGMGVKHSMTFALSETHFITENVAYVHNWVFYMLMAGGLPGFLLYATLLCQPVLARLKALKLAPPSRANAEILLRTVLLTLAIYALFFAAARLITFNLLIAAAWAMSLANRQLNQDTRARPA